MPDRRKPEPFSAVDAAWLRMDQPTNLTLINGVLMFDEPIEFERLKHVIEQRVLRFDRFRQRVSYPQGIAGPPHWEFDPYFDLRSHLHHIALPPPGDQAALQDLVSDLMSTPLDMHKPLWQWYLIDGYNGGCALMTRLHHCIADGVALVRVLLSMTDDTPDAPDPEEPAPKRSRNSSPVGAMIHTAAQTISTTRRTAQMLWHEGMETITNPFHALDLMQLGTSSAAALSKLLLMPPDPPTVFKGKLGVAKRAAWSTPISLEDVKLVGKATGSTINDVLLACVTGALRRYMLQRGQQLDGLNIRAAVPVNLRPPDAPLEELGNRFGLVFLALPVGRADPLDRLLDLKERMDAIKRSPEAMVAFGLLNAIGMMAHEIEQIIVGIFGSKATGVMTNVPGPRHAIYLAGKRLSGVMFWVPQPGYLGLGVSIFSYNGQVRVGFATDATIVPDPDHIVAAFHEELDQLHDMAVRANSYRHPHVER